MAIIVLHAVLETH